MQISLINAFFCTAVCLLSIFPRFTCFIAFPRETFNYSSKITSVKSHLLHLHENLSSVLGLLVDDVDMDGNIDMYICTVSGKLFGFSNVRGCLTHSSCDDPNTHWPVLIQGETFLSSPIAVDIDGKGMKHLIVVSSHGTIYTLNHLGMLISRFQIPDIVISSSFNSSFEKSKHTNDNIHWFTSEDLVTEKSGKIYRLYPRIYTNPLFVTITNSVLDHTNRAMNGDILLMTANFLSTNNNNNSNKTHTFIVAALIMIPKCLLLDSVYVSSGDCSLGLKVLEADLLSSPKPPFLFSAPIIFINPSLASEFHSGGTPNFLNVIITTYSANIHLVQLPFNNTINISSKFETKTFQISDTPMIQSCLLVECPSNNKLRVGKSNFHICCIVVDIYSCVRFIQMNVQKKMYKPKILWQYCPVNKFHSDYSLQTSELSVVPGCSENNKCSDWILYTTPDSYAHALDIRTGLLVDGYPINLSPLEHASGNSVASGTGVLYRDLDFTYWMLFSFTNGLLIRLRLQNPLVIYSSINLSVNESIKVWFNPKPILLNDQFHSGLSLNTPDSHDQKSLYFLLITDNGLRLIDAQSFSLPNYIPYISTVPKKNVHLFQFISASFLNKNGQPTDYILLNSINGLIDYQIKNCRTNLISNQSNVKRHYLVRLTTSFGLPITDWSPIYYSPTHPTDQCEQCVCMKNQLVIDRIPIGPYKGQIFLCLIDLSTGHVISDYSFVTGSSDISIKAKFEIDLVWIQLIISLTYLPIVYCFLGLIIMYLFSVSSFSVSSFNNPNKICKIYSA